MVAGAAGQVCEIDPGLYTKCDDSLDRCDNLARYCDLRLRRLSDGLSQMQELSKRNLVFVVFRRGGGDTAALSRLNKSCRKSLGAGLVGLVGI